ncbi:hypothetical protein EDC01DRAFT_116586 [Geopyxis carbonaria]|nr:hypothetical protein EDC01DRAFT_116586 [Geopyxis carbonaria]
MGLCVTNIALLISYLLIVPLVISFRLFLFTHTSALGFWCFRCFFQLFIREGSREAWEVLFLCFCLLFCLLVVHSFIHWTGVYIDFYLLWVVSFDSIPQQEKKTFCKN